MIFLYFCGLKKGHGKLAEWLKAAVSKTAVVSQLPGVRIPHFPLGKRQRYALPFFVKLPFYFRRGGRRPG